MKGKLSYEKLYSLLNKKGESLSSLTTKGIVTDFSARRIRNGEHVNTEHLVNICVFFNVPIDAIIEVIFEDSTPLPE